MLGRISCILATVMLVLLPVPCRLVWAGVMDGTFELDGNAINDNSIAGDDWNALFPVHQPSAVDLARVLRAAVIEASGLNSPRLSAS